MAGSVLRTTPTAFPASDVGALIREFNLLADVTLLPVEDLAAGADIAARALFKVPARCTSGIFVIEADAIHQANSVGVDGSNTAIITLRNITQGVDIATVTLTANVTANNRSALTITAANADAAANDIIGIVVTQGATANMGALTIQMTWVSHDRIGRGDGVAFSSTV